MTPPPISRDGLARCPSCLTHVAVAADPRATVCPFCGSSFAAPTATVSRAGSSALVAALGLSLAMAGCNPKADASDDPREPGERATPEAPATPQPAVYGGPPRNGPRVPEPVPERPSDPDTDTNTDTDADTDTDAEPPPPAAPPPPLRQSEPSRPVYGGPPVREPRPQPRPTPPSDPDDAPTPPPPPSDDAAQTIPPSSGPIEVVPLYGVAPMEPRRRQ